MNLRPLVRSAAFLAVVPLLGCAPPAGTEEATPAQGHEEEEVNESELHATSRECVLATLTLDPGFIGDLAAAVDPSMVKKYAGRYDHVEVPKALDAAVIPVVGESDAVSTLHGFDVGRADGQPGLQAYLEAGGGSLADPALKLTKQRYATAKALYDALTRAVQTTEDHIVPPTQVYDRSWTMVTRTSKAGRITCSKRSYQDFAASGSLPDYHCTFTGLQRVTIQSYNTKYAACPVTP